jgi:hypothetical protein
MVFFQKFLVGKIVFDSQKIRKFMAKAPVHEFRVFHGLPGTEFLQSQQKAGVIHCDFTLHHRVIVVQYQAGIFQHNNQLQSTGQSIVV